MRGIDEARAFYLEYGQQMIAKNFPEYEGKIAVGFAGHGSECFGFDDEISRDHDFEKGFCLWLTDEDDLKIGVELDADVLKHHVVNVTAPARSRVECRVGVSDAVAVFEKDVLHLGCAGFNANLTLAAVDD